MTTFGNNGPPENYEEKQKTTHPWRLTQLSMIAQRSGPSPPLAGSGTINRQESSNIRSRWLRDMVLTNNKLQIETKLLGLDEIDRGRNDDNNCK